MSHAESLPVRALREGFERRSAAELAGETASQGRAAEIAATISELLTESLPFIQNQGQEYFSVVER